MTSIFQGLSFSLRRVGRREPWERGCAPRGLVVKLRLGVPEFPSSFLDITFFSSLLFFSFRLFFFFFSFSFHFTYNSFVMFLYIACNF